MKRLVIYCIGSMFCSASLFVSKLITSLTSNIMRVIVLLANRWITRNPRREGTLGRHEPPLCRHEPPRVARQTKPPLCRRFFKLVFKVLQKDFFEIFRHSGMRGFTKIIIDSA